MRAQPANSSSKPKLVDFDPTPYIRNSLKEEDVLEAKEAFDSFDVEHVGSINPKGTPGYT
jgi:hypothetical protein